MHLQRNFVWTLDLSDRELKVIVKCLGKAELTEKEQSLAKKLAESLPPMVTRLERVSNGRRRKHSKSD